MKFVCYKEFDDPAEPVFPGLLHKGRTLPLARVLAVADALHPRGLTSPDDLNALVEQLAHYVPVWKELEKSKILDQIWQEIGVVLAAPLPRPNRILAIGRNYPQHAEELGYTPPDEPIVFQKASSAVIGDGRPIVLPHGMGRIDFEGELAVVIGKHGKHVAEKDALGIVAGYTLANDVTARDMQKRNIARGLPWFLAKSFDTFAPLGPCMVTADEIKNPGNLELTVTVNDIVRQQVNTSQMLFSIPKLISYISNYLALEPGDIILTGTPPGVGPLQSGDMVEIRIPEIGTLSNPVIDEVEL